MVAGSLRPGGQGGQVQAVPLPGEHQAADVPLVQPGQDGLQSLLRAAAAGQVHLQLLITALAKGDEVQLRPAAVHPAGQHALVPQLVKAPALGAAGIGIGDGARPQDAAGGVDMAQGHIIHAGGGKLLRGDGIVAAAGGQVPVEDHEAGESRILLGPEAGQQGPLAHRGGEGPAVDRAAQAGELHPLHAPGEDADVVRPADRGVRGGGGPEVVVARGDEHRDVQAAQGPGQGLGSLVKGGAAVEQVAGQQQQVGPPVPGQVGQPVQQLPLLRPALGGLVLRQGTEGGVQMEVGRVYNGQHRGNLFSWVIGCPPAPPPHSGGCRCRW